MTAAPRSDAASSWDETLDALRAASEHHRLVFENEEVRVLATRIGAGETTAVHVHRWPSVVFFQSPGHFVRRDGDGNVLLDTREHGAPPEAGSAAWSPPLAPHTVENVGAGAVEFLSVELKRP